MSDEEKADCSEAVEIEMLKKRIENLESARRVDTNAMKAARVYIEWLEGRVRELGG